MVRWSPSFYDKTICGCTINFGSHICEVKIPSSVSYFIRRAKSKKEKSTTFENTLTWIKRKLLSLKNLGLSHYWYPIVDAWWTKEIRWLRLSKPSRFGERSFGREKCSRKLETGRESRKLEEQTKFQKWEKVRAHGNQFANWWKIFLYLSLNAMGCHLKIIFCS